MYNHNNQLHFILCILGEGSFLNILNCSFAFLWLSHKIHLYLGFSHSRSIANCTFSTFFSYVPLKTLYRQDSGNIQILQYLFTNRQLVNSLSIAYTLFQLPDHLQRKYKFQVFQFTQILVQENQIRLEIFIQTQITAHDVNY